MAVGRPAGFDARLDVARVVMAKRRAEEDARRMAAEATGAASVIPVLEAVAANLRLQAAQMQAEIARLRKQAKPKGRPKPKGRAGNKPRK